MILENITASASKASGRAGQITAIDADMVYFKFFGNSTVQTEFGVYTKWSPAVMRFPAASPIAPSDADSLRYFCQSHEAVDYVMNEDQHEPNRLRLSTTVPFDRTAGADAPARGQSGRCIAGRWARRPDGGGARL